MRPKLLIVEDDPDVCLFLDTVARDSGFDTAHADSTVGFRELWPTFRPDLILLDLRLRDGDGVELLRFLGDRQATDPIVLMSGVDRRLLDTTTAYGRSHGLDIVGVIKKPVMLDELRRLLATHRTDAIGPERLERALDGGEIRPYYQPVFHLDAVDSWTLVGVEALVRWQHPVRGVLLPQDFLHLAESPATMARLTEQVLAQTGRTLQRWRHQGIAVWASVNFAPALLRDLQWPDRIATGWARDGLSPEALTIELTEQGVMADAQQAMEILARFRLKGFGLAIDDFGTGYSSLLQLYRLPFDRLKIDRSFVADLDHSEEARTIVRCLVELGRGLGLTVCAEGVESQGALQYLWDVGCRAAQGWLFCRALPEDDLLEATASGEWRVVPPS